MRALCFFNACRLAAGIGMLRSATIDEAKATAASKDAYRTQKMALLQEQAAAATSTLALAKAAPAVMQLAPALAPNTVHVSEIADAASAQTVTVMEMPEFQELFKNFKGGIECGDASWRGRGRPQRTGEINSPSQLSVLRSRLAVASCYVDLALWGDQRRRRRRRR